MACTATSNNLNATIKLDRHIWQPRLIKKKLKLGAKLSTMLMEGLEKVVKPKRPWVVLQKEFVSGWNVATEQCKRREGKGEREGEREGLHSFSILLGPCDAKAGKNQVLR